MVQVKKKPKTSNTNKTELVSKIVPDLTKLPALPQELENEVLYEGVEKSEQKLVRFWGAYLFQVTDGHSHPHWTTDDSLLL